ncbi:MULTISPECIES: c-type cytochrome [Ralstonia solanacearum species complex]|nr:c-type cytochrome [Ralstonia pseudosolanacearum]CUV23891.1 putative oxidoreductase cytochrome c552 signal peptide protein [Ralstonia solanacearum]MDO3522063.1 c-type cytochrome [Ralstonia pseudosolanacearum]MDO3548858.1 c-type cytochrome [Ralstonia pseudosolanacearum]MDO3553903.1 c-type cytochrome [Ralstonia pseudosolanacearum]MDO3569218.1 c-type cytochrome [Ralstonia pseudosolanacearum]
MYKTCLLLILAWMGASAQASDALASRYACVACHQPAVKTVGPSWSDIAAKYADGSKSAEQLAASIKRGGSGNWGPVPMPAQPALSDADALALAKWVLGKHQPKS